MPSVQRVRWARFRVTVVSTVALAILATLAFLLTGGTLLEPKTHLYLSIPDATGLDSGSPVRVDGIGVGVVDWVRLSGSNDPSRIIRVRMTIESERLPSITSDSIAQISNDSLIGDKFVDVTTGRASGHITENGELRFKAQPDLMRSVDLTDFERELRSVDATLNEMETGKSPLGQFILGEQVYDSLRRRFTELQTALRNATSTTAQMGGALYTDALYRKIREPLQRFDQSVAALQSGQGGMGHFLRDPAQFEQLRSGLRDLLKMVADARASGLVASESDYVAWNRALESLAQQMEEVNVSPALNSQDLYESWSGAAHEMQSTLKDFRENPRKYLRLKVF